MANYSIKDLENFTGIKAHTIRIWEKRYNIVEPKRTCTNIRYYDDEDLKKLLNVSILNRNGLKISNIVNLSEETINEKILNLAQTNNDLNSQIESMVLSMIDMDENKFDKVFNNAVINFGFEETMLKLVYPFFEKIGVLWQIGTINPAQEHFISSLIRQKLIVAIDGIIQKVTENTRSFLLFLPEGEYHEIGLIFYHYLIKKHNHKVVYLGESVPFDALLEVAKVKKIDYLLTSIITPVVDDQLTTLLENLSENFKDSKLFVAGLQVQNIDPKNNGNIQPISSSMEFKKILESIS
ncbi:MAG: MerR family transcriptional regulator [Bacteroidetes bacterium]|nr:MerR family transcriptional regulator [Bacteroidota bacterium]